MFVVISLPSIQRKPTALRKPFANTRWFLPSKSISKIEARKSSVSSHALQLLPTETYSLLLSAIATVRVKCQPPYL